MKKKIKRERKIGSKVMNCECGRPVPNTDLNAGKVVCSRCVARMLNPSAIFLRDFPDEEFQEFIKNI